MAELQETCTYCQEEIHGVRVQCCACLDFDICLQCFSTGAEIGSHKSDHAYRFIDHCTVSIFGGKSNWTGREQLQLLDAIEEYGLGNWDDISKYIETKTHEEVRDEYTLRYLTGSIGKATWREVNDQRPDVQDLVKEDTGPLAPNVIAKLPPLDITFEEARSLGYTPFRDDFEREYEYDISAEQLASSLELNMTEDSDVEIALKLAQVDMYVRRLRERCRRKRVIRDYQLVRKFFQSHKKEATISQPGRSLEQFNEILRPFSQFLTSGEWTRLVESLNKEQSIRNRIDELIRYRSMGLTSQEEIVHYEQHVKFIEQLEQSQNKTGSSGVVSNQPGNFSESEERRKEEPNFIERRFTLPNYDGFDCYSNNNMGSSSDLTVPISLVLLLQGKNLTQSELKFCSALHVEPNLYRTLKAMIIQDHILSNKIMQRSTVDGDSVSNGETTTFTSVKDVVSHYINTAGWIPSISE